MSVGWSRFSIVPIRWSRENIAAVSASDIARVANKYIDPDRALIVIVGNASQIREPLGTLGFPIHDLDVDGNLLPVA